MFDMIARKIIIEGFILILLQVHRCNHIISFKCHVDATVFVSETSIKCMRIPALKINIFLENDFLIQNLNRTASNASTGAIYLNSKK